MLISKIITEKRKKYIFFAIRYRIWIGTEIQEKTCYLFDLKNRFSLKNIYF